MSTVFKISKIKNLSKSAERENSAKTESQKGSRAYQPAAIAARNEWLQLREKSPVFVLAKLEKERPGGVELKSFESDENKGTIKMVTGDLDTASRYMNAVLGNSNVRVTMEERVNNGILAVCSWNE